MQRVKYIAEVLEDGHLSLSPRVKRVLHLGIGTHIEVVLRKLAEKERKKDEANPLFELVGLCEKGREDGSVNHDKYLYSGGNE